MAARIPLASRVARRIRQDYIDNGALAVGDQLPSVRELRKQYVTSMATVAHALSQLEAQGLVVRYQGRGCFVAHEQRPISPNHGPVRIGLILPAPSSSEMMTRLYEGVSHGCRRYGYHLLLSTAENRYRAERAALHELFAAGCRGVVMHPAVRSLSDVRDDYLNTEFVGEPIVLVGTALPEHHRAQIVFDNYNAGYEMTRLLLLEGHTRIAFMKFYHQDSELLYRATSERYQGWLAALTSAGIRPESDWLWEVAADFSAGFGASLGEFVRHLTQWRGSSERPSALIALEDNCAVAVATCAREMGIASPEELRVAGFDNLMIGQAMRPPFPTTVSDFARAGAMAVDLINRQLRTGNADTRVYVLPVELLPRGLEAIAEADAVPAT